MRFPPFAVAHGISTPQREAIAEGLKRFVAASEPDGPAAFLSHPARPLRRPPAVVR